jgi:hypothetical protein
MAMFARSGLGGWFRMVCGALLLSGLIIEVQSLAGESQGVRQEEDRPGSQAGSS